MQEGGLVQIPLRGAGFSPEVDPGNYQNFSELSQHCVRSETLKRRRETNRVWSWEKLGKGRLYETNKQRNNYCKFERPKERIADQQQQQRISSTETKTTELQ